LQKRIDDVSAELVAKNSEIHKLNASADDKNRVIRDQQTTTNTLSQTTQLEALQKELQAEKDKYILKVNDLKNDIDFAQRELEKEKEERRNDTKLRKEAEQNRLDDLRSEMKQEIIMLKNSQEASTINRLQERVDFYEKENADLQDSGKEGWKNILKRRDQKLREKEAELVKANANVRHWHRLYNLFHRRWEGLERNQAFKLGEATYEEAKESLFMGKDHDLKSAME
jgi:chromosome segregation ATPase